MSSTRLLQR